MSGKKGSRSSRSLPSGVLMAPRRSGLALLLVAHVAVGRRFSPRPPSTLLIASRDRERAVRPTVIAASHNLTGYEPACAADGDSDTCWLVPGGQRMEMMS